MALADKWTERFGISEKDFANITAKAETANTDPLRWCLINGKIPEPEYVDWAMRRFELPCVSGDFFTAPYDPAFWDRVSALHPWHAGLFPLADWEGVLLIGCLEPPNEFKFAKPHRFVLASARHLLLRWDQLNPQAPGKSATETTKKPTPKSTAPAVAQPAEKIPPLTDMPEGLTISLPAEPESVERSMVTSLKDLGELSRIIPEGLSLKDTPLISDAPMQMTDPGSLPSLDPVEMPEGLMPAAKSAPPNVTQTSPSMRTEILINSESREAAKKTQPVVATAPATPKKEAKPIQVEKQSPAPVVEAKTDSADNSENEMREITGFTISSVDKRPISSAVDFNDLGILAMAHTLKSFDGAMVLSIEGDQLKPWKWSDYMTSPKNGNLPLVSLELPSFFRVVERTRLPYHGYVAPSEINDKFFAAYSHSGKLPEHITLVPILYQRRLLGMMLGISKKPLNYKTVLTPFEKLAEEVAQQMAKFIAAEAA